MFSRTARELTPSGGKCSLAIKSKSFNVVLLVFGGGLRVAELIGFRLPSSIEAFIIPRSGLSSIRPPSAHTAMYGMLSLRH